MTVHTTADPPGAPSPSEPPQLPHLTGTQLLRWAWRQLTSMRTALFLLLLLAVASVPGSIWPQRNIDAGRVADYLSTHTTTGPWMDRLRLFDVYSSPWFAAIYLLLFISLIGCVIPRSRTHWRAMRARPPATPRNLQRLPGYLESDIDISAEEAEHITRAVLRERRFRLRAGQGAGMVSAERGYLRETGNLVFHLSLTLIVVAVAMGYLLGWRGDVIVPTGGSFASSVSTYDTLSPGPWVDTATLPDFRVRIDKFTVSFEESAQGAQFGAPREFVVDATTQDSPTSPAHQQVLSTNHPLTLGGAKLFLLGNGYAPVVTVRDARGQVIYQQPTPFLPQDNNYRSIGAIKIPGATPQQLGFTGLFLPTATIDPAAGPISIFPDLKAPALVLTAYEGNLFPGGRPQSVYSLDTRAMSQLRDAAGQPVRIWLTPGATVQLPGGRGSISLTDVKRFAGISVRHDPGSGLALVAAVTALVGLMLSLTVRRRRIFVRITSIAPIPPAHSSLSSATAAHGVDAPRQSPGTRNRAHPQTGVESTQPPAYPTPRVRLSIAGLAPQDDPSLPLFVKAIHDTIIHRLGINQ